MITLTGSDLDGWTIAQTVAGVLWWSVTYHTEAEAREALKRMEKEYKR